VLRYVQHARKPVRRPCASVYPLLDSKPGGRCRRNPSRDSDQSRHGGAGGRSPTPSHLPPHGARLCDSPAHYLASFCSSMDARAYTHTTHLPAHRLPSLLLLQRPSRRTGSRLPFSVWRGQQRALLPPLPRCSTSHAVAGRVGARLLEICDKLPSTQRAVRPLARLTQEQPQLPRAPPLSTHSLTPPASQRRTSAPARPPRGTAARGAVVPRDWVFSLSFPYFRAISTVKVGSRRRPSVADPPLSFRLLESCLL
jgi:hypothetical protein